MVVKKHWSSKKGSGLLQVKTWWMGYFLFGVVPLYMTMTRREEYDKTYTFN